MQYALIELNIQNDTHLDVRDMKHIDIADAVAALEEQLPDLPRGAHWSVNVNY